MAEYFNAGLFPILAAYPLVLSAFWAKFTVENVTKRTERLLLLLQLSLYGPIYSKRSQCTIGILIKNICLSAIDG